MANLTKRLVELLTPPAAGDLFAWDDRLKGFGVRVKPSGAKSYVLRYRNRHGVSRRFTFARHGELTAEEARKKAAAMLAEIRLGADPAGERREQRQAKTLADLIDTYLAEAPTSRPNKRPRSWQSDRSNLTRHVRPLLGMKPVQLLTRADIERWQADVAAGKTAIVERVGPRAVAHVEGGKGAASRALANLRAMLSWAVEREIIADNPAKGVRPFHGRKCERFLSTEEVARLGEALVTLQAEGELNAHAAAAIRLLVLTGCRKSEILTLQWPFVSFNRRCLDLPDSKTGAKAVPLAPSALEVLAGLPRDEPRAGRSHWVFPAARGGGCYSLPYKDWQRVAARAGLPGVRMHDLRHSYASVAVSDGISLYITAKLLGHRQSRTTERYAHLHDDPVRAAAERTAKRLADAMRGSAGANGV
jgi:integrase